MRERRWEDRTPSAYVRAGHLESRYLLLFGLAFECLFKGLELQRCQESGVETPSNLFSTHRVSEFARTSFLRSEPELELLNKLEQFVLWSGKYAVPKKADTLKKSIVTEGATQITENEIAVLDAMFADLIELLPEAWPNLWEPHKLERDKKKMAAEGLS